MCADPCVRTISADYTHTWISSMNGLTKSKWAAVSNLCQTRFHQMVFRQATVHRATPSLSHLPHIHFPQRIFNPSSWALLLPSKHCFTTPHDREMVCIEPTWPQSYDLFLLVSADYTHIWISTINGLTHVRIIKHSDELAASNTLGFACECGRGVYASSCA